MIKKIVSAVFSFVFAANLFTVPIASAAIGDKAIVEFSKGTPAYTNIKLMNFGEVDNSFDYVKRAGRNAIRMVKANRCYFMKLDLDDKVFPEEPKGAATNVTVDYFDEGNGYFTLRYDSVQNNVRGLMEDHSDIVKMTDSKTWKSYTFYMEDAAYRGTWQNTDFNIALYSDVGEKVSSGDIIIGKVEIEKCFPEKPVSRALSSASTGNILGGDEDRKLVWNFENVTDLKLDMKYNWAVYDEYGNQIQKESFEKSFEPGEKFDCEWIANAKNFGIYKVSEESIVEYEQGGERKTSKSLGVHDFSIVNKFKEGETKNDKMIACTHIVSQGYDKYKTSEIASEAGFSRLRDELRWSAVEKKRGVYDFSGDMDFPYVIEDNKMKLHYIAAFANPNYESCLNNGVYSEGRMPSTKEDLDAFVKYMMAVLDKYHDQIDSVEIWNEPNNADFNGGEDGATQMGTYTNLAKACYPAIKAKYPDMPVVIFGMAGSDIPNVTAAMELGIYNYCDAVSVHPYQWNGQFSQSGYISDLQNLRDVMAKYGNGNIKEVWLTEMGYTSGNACRAGVTPEKQAIYLVQTYVIAIGQQLIDRYYWYNLQNKGTQIGVQESNFGLIGHKTNCKQIITSIDEAPDFTAPNTAWSAKRSYVAATEMNKLLAEAEIEKRPEIGEKRQAYQFMKKNGERVNVIWSDKQEAENVTFRVDGTANILDMYGNVIGSMENDSFTVTLGDRPIYIEGNYSNCTVTDTEIACSGTDITIANGDYFNLKFTDAKNRDLRIDAETSDALLVAERDEALSEGEGEIKLVTADSAKIGKQKIKADFYNGDKLVGSTDIYVNIIEPITLTVSENRNQKSLDRYTANVTIRNMSEVSSYSGSCKITEPQELSDNSNTAHFSALRPGESIVVPLTMPRAVEKKYYDVSILAELTNGKSVLAEKSIRLESQRSRLMNGNLVLMSKVNRAPTIDGVISEGEWSGQPLDVSTEDKYYNLGEAWKGPEDSSFKAWTAWDDNYFYLAVEAEDDVFSQENVSGSMWQGDSIQFGIVDGEPDHLKSTKYNEYGMALLKDGPALYRFSTISDYLPGGDVENVELKITREGTKTCYEMKLPWSEAVDKDFKPAEGSSISFSIIMNDNDGPMRKGYIMYTDGIGTTKSAALFKCFDFAE